MCLVIKVRYEFSTWRALEECLRFVEVFHSANYPRFQIFVPVSHRGCGWKNLTQVVSELKFPQNLDEQSIYGYIQFDTTRDELRGVKK